MTMTEITKEILVEKGYEHDVFSGYTKDFGDTTIGVGAPRNEMCVFARFNHLPGTVITKAESLEDLELLERVLGGAFVDHDFMEFDDDDPDSD
jgi:hypothetical protein